ncbi:NUDIX domain-containing protein [Candidatus Dojkabacteria bacterium]|nr:NUDIX domain-containing protein [Candidatus Dojkabacteria bacterium]
MVFTRGTVRKQLWGSFGVILKDNSVILQQRNDPNPQFHEKWALPGGIIQFGEHPEETLYRRCKEEIGIKVFNLDLIPVVQSYLFEENNQLTLLHYVAKTKNKRLRNLDDGEDILQIKWFPIKTALTRVPLLRGTDEVLKAAFRK